MARIFLLLGALNGLLAVALGAFGAHALRDRMTADLYGAFQTGTEYHAVHALALLAIGLLALQQRSQLLLWSGTLISVGILLFSGSLYLLSISGTHQFGIITPIGGITLLAGWSCLVGAAWRLPDE